MSSRKQQETSPGYVLTADLKQQIPQNTSTPYVYPRKYGSKLSSNYHHSERISLRAPLPSELFNRRKKSAEIVAEKKIKVQSCYLSVIIQLLWFELLSIEFVNYLHKYYLTKKIHFSAKALHITSIATASIMILLLTALFYLECTIEWKKKNNNSKHQSYAMLYLTCYLIAIAGAGWLIAGHSGSLSNNKLLLQNERHLAISWTLLATTHLFLIIASFLKLKANQKKAKHNSLSNPRKVKQYAFSLFIMLLGESLLSYNHFNIASHTSKVGTLIVLPFALLATLMYAFKKYQEHPSQCLKSSYQKKSYSSYSESDSYDSEEGYKSEQEHDRSFFPNPIKKSTG